MLCTALETIYTNEKHYLVEDALWRCKTEDEKHNIFLGFLSDKKKKQKQRYITSKDGTLSIPDKTKGTAKKPNATKRLVNVRTTTTTKKKKKRKKKNGEFMTTHSWLPQFLF